MNDFSFAIGDRVRVIPIDTPGSVTGRVDLGHGHHEFKVLYWINGARHEDWLRADELRVLIEGSYYQTGDGIRTSVVDILTDMQHLCDCEAIDFNDALRLARDHHAEELKG